MVTKKSKNEERGKIMEKQQSVNSQELKKLNSGENNNEQ